MEGKGREMDGRAIGRKMAQWGRTGQGRGRHEGLCNPSPGKTKHDPMRSHAKQVIQAVELSWRLFLDDNCPKVSANETHSRDD
jgi:hypothetical protein